MVHAELSQSNSEWLSSNWKGKALDYMVRRGSAIQYDRSSFKNSET